MAPVKEEPLRTVLVGCRGIARFHLRPLSELDGFRVVALADLEEERAAETAEAFGVERVYADYGAMLERERPDVAVITTPSALHSPMTLQAVEAGVRGVYCEKPMAVSLGEGRAMVRACREAGVALAVNHQRRLLPAFVRMRELIAGGAVGRLQLLRGYCAGDALSDATHLVDLVRHLNGDLPVRWVFGQVHRRPVADHGEGAVSGARAGWRYGHPVETGAFAVMEFENQVRAELLSGDIRPPGSVYAEVEALGAEGRLRRPGDRSDTPLLLEAGAGWQPVDCGEEDRQEVYRRLGADCYRRFAAMVQGGAEHPLSGDSALRDLEVVMAIYESARTRNRIELPLGQEAFPLQLMLDAGDI
jgi:predicted dehydrogenase